LENGIEECYNHFVTIETFMKWPLTIIKILIMAMRSIT
jgi:hypothetical protein